MQLEVWADRDNGTTGIVHALAKKILAETALLALDHVRKGLERTAVCAVDGPAAAAIVEKRVHSFLEHALFIANNDFRRAKLHKPFQAVVAVDHTAVKVVEIACGETSAIQRHKRTQFGGNDRNNLHDHPFGAILGFQKSFNNFQALGQLFLLGLTPGFVAFLAQVLLELLEVEFLQQHAHGFRAHADLESFVIAKLVKQQKILLLADNLLLGQVGVPRVKHNIGIEIKHLFQIGHCHVKQGADF